MDMATALAELGVTAATLDAEATERLDRDGYVALPDVLSGQQVEAVRARLAELLAAEGQRAVPSAIAGSAGSANSDAMMESRPNRAMNHGAPAASAGVSGWSGSKMRSAPRSLRLRTSVAFTASSPVMIRGPASRHSLVRVAGPDWSSGRSSGNDGEMSTPSTTGHSRTWVFHTPRAGTTT